jgi:iron complex outermembrane receptor protein
MSLTPNGADLNRGEWLEGSTPRRMAGLRSLLSLGERFELDAQLRYLSRIDTIPVAVTVENSVVEAYTELDLRMGWRVNERCELSLAAQNLLDDQHAEFGPVSQRGNLERAAYLKVSLHL